MDLASTFGPNFVEKIVHEFGIESESDDAKAYLIGQLAENISGRMLLEARKLIPEEKQDEFRTLIEKTEASAIERFLATYISDFQSFVRTEAQKEIERTKTYMLEETTG